MEKHSSKKKSNLTWITVIAVVAIIIIVIALLYYPRGETSKAWFTDPENDVELNVGTGSLGIIDITNASLEAIENVLKVTIHTRDPITDLADGEFAQWNVTIILEHGESNAYEICVEKNATRLQSLITRIGEWNASSCDVEVHENVLTVQASISELKTAKDVDWLILTFYEKTFENEVVVDGSDIAPDEGLQTTILKN